MVTESSSAEARRQRREMVNRLAAEDLQALDALTMEMASLKTGNPLTAENIRLRLYRIAEVFSIAEFPRGYKVLGGTSKTPHYVTLGTSRASDDQLVADAMMGWLTEIADVLEKRVAAARPKAILPVDKETPSHDR